MKDSGIKSIGQIPNSWEIIKTKYIADISIGLVTTMTANYVDADEGVPLIRNGNIRCNKIDENGMVYLSKKFANANKNRQLKKGHIATVHTGDIGTSVLIPEEYDGCMGFATIQSVPKEQIVYPEYLCWFFNSEAFKLQCIEYCTGDGRQNLNLYDFVDLKITIPKINEQKEIVEFLNDKVGKIDDILCDLRKQVETLQKYKKSVITKAVTKGLNPDVAMKDSGIDWIGEIPEHWDIKPLKYSVDCNRNTLLEKTNPEYKFRYIDIGSVSFMNGIEEYQEMLFADAPSRARRVVKNGDTIISTVRTYLKAITRIEDDENVIVSTGFAVLSPKLLCDKYLEFYIKSEVFCQEVDMKSFGIAYPAINTTMLIGIKTLLPPINEQQEIADYLVDKCSKIDELIKDKEAQIEKMEKYKKSLIYEYVTGKKRVKGAV